MRVLVQWAQRNPRDWIEVDSSAWGSLPDLGIPARGVLGGRNNATGWVNRLCVQGVHFPHDHYAVEDLTDGSGGVRVTTWHEDSDDYPPDEFVARVWTFLPLFQDPRVGGLWNTRQSQVIYAAPKVYQVWQSVMPGNTELRPWEEFIRPPAGLTRHGVNLDNAKYAEHVAALRRVDFREWVPG